MLGRGDFVSSDVLDGDKESRDGLCLNLLPLTSFEISRKSAELRSLGKCFQRDLRNIWYMYIVLSSGLRRKRVILSGQ